jgi:hypothetical protein
LYRCHQRYPPSPPRQQRVETELYACHTADEYCY